MYALIEFDSDYLSEASPTVELFASEVVARLALARKFAPLMRTYWKNMGETGSRHHNIICERLEKLNVTDATNDQYWRSLEVGMANWHETYRTDLDWYSTFWIVETKSGKNPLAPDHVPGLPDH